MTRFAPSTDDAAAGVSRRAMRINVHGHAVEIVCALPGVRQVMTDLLAELSVEAWPDGFTPVEGRVEVYDADAVARSISPQAEPVLNLANGAEVWRDGERTWLIDENWGLCEINFLKRTWRSWVLDATQIDPLRATEHAVLWPMAQVLAVRGLPLLPAPSVVHRGRGVLLLAPFNLEPELAMLLSAGHAVVGQRWTALQDEAGRCLLRSMPGRVERSPIPQLRMKSSVDARVSMPKGVGEWYDLLTIAGASATDAGASYAWCGAVFVIEPGRRAIADARALTGASAAAAVRHAWPMPDVGPGSRQSKRAVSLVQSTPVYQIELSRDPRALLRLLDSLPSDADDRARLKLSIPGTRVPQSLAG
jgi:hypothetical protein